MLQHLTLGMPQWRPPVPSEHNRAGKLATASSVTSTCHNNVVDKTIIGLPMPAFDRIGIFHHSSLRLGVSEYV